MQEIEGKEKDIGRKVYINAIPNLKLIPKDKVETILAVLELDISEYMINCSNNQAD